MTIRLTFLMDNSPGREGLSNEHGLSVFVEAAGGNVLFDTGAGPAFAANSAKLGIDLGTTNAIALSHGHYDHSAGLDTALTLAPGARLFLSPYSVVPHYSRRASGEVVYAGMPPQFFTALGAGRERVTWVIGPTEIAAGIRLTGPVPRIADFEDVGEPFFLVEDTTVPDPIIDDQALILETARGMVIVLGCAHSGVVNTLRYVSLLTGSRRIHAVVGGTHLIEPSQLRLERTVEALAELGVELFAPAHCTGEAAMAYFKDRLPGIFRAVGVGSVLEFD